jgi:membrane-bound lytic murein transglycosylase D
MRNRVLLVIGSIVAGLFLTIIFTNWRTVEGSSEGQGGEKMAAELFSHYRIHALPIPESFSFAGEQVPLHVFDVRERFDRELLVNTYWQSQTMLFFKRANRWFPVIEPILERNGLPDDFKYLALIESGLMNVVSPAGASGFWQILEGTGRELGLEVNSQIDERYHVEKATEAACKYLKNAKNRFGTWTMAAAAYNIGNARLTGIVQTQKVSDYYDLHLNEETSRYVFRILAIKAIFANPAASGFFFQPEDLYEPFVHFTVNVDTTITNLPDFALRYQTNYKTLRLMNPWLRDYQLPNRSRKMYQLKIPVAVAE